jgi:hypothetical protein
MLSHHACHSSSRYVLYSPIGKLDPDANVVEAAFGAYFEAPITTL